MCMHICIFIYIYGNIYVHIYLFRLLMTYSTIRKFRAMKEMHLPKYLRAVPFKCVCGGGGGGGGGTEGFLKGGRGRILN